MPEWLLTQRLRAGTALIRQTVNRIDSSWVHGRGKNPHLENLVNKRVTILGCGSLGSHVAVRLAQAGIGELILVDPELMESANAGRHVLGIVHLGTPKAGALALEIGRRFPHIRKIESIESHWESMSKENLDKVKDSDLIISAIGEWGPEGLLSDWQVKNADAPSIIYGWLEEHAAAAHALLVKGRPGCLKCLLSGDGNMIEPETVWESGNELQAEPACGSLFQPFGPTDLANAEAMLSRMAIDTLMGRYEGNAHKVSAVSTWHLTQMGGEWTESHNASRPRDFHDHFEFQRLFTPRADCSCVVTN